jgi:tRNA (guanosine-2'-O-)-methyltransferase
MMHVVTDAIGRFIERHGPEAVCAALAPMLTAERIARIDRVLAARLVSVVTIVEDTYDPHNAAATIRTTEALGLGELHVVEPDQRFSIAGGVTCGAHRWIELHRWRDIEAAVAALHARGFRVFATLPGARHTIDDVDVTAPLAVAFGNEHAGLTPAAIAACDGAIGVPMFGFTESFNLSVTVALAMSRIAARRRAAIGGLGDLHETRRRELRARWFALKLRGAVGILERALGDGRAAARPR